MTTQLQSRPPQQDSLEAKDYYKQGYNLVKQALSSDERRDLPQAYQLYVKAKRLLKTALTLSAHENEIAKIKSLLQKVELRIRDFESKLTQQQPPGANYTDNPPSYNDSVGDKLVAASKGDKPPHGMNILLSLDKVTIYQVQTDGDTVSYSPNTLYLCEYTEKVKGQPPAFLGCGSWVMPIVPNKTIVYRPTGYLYMFPDPMTYSADCDVSQSFAGLVLDSSLPEKERNRFKLCVESLCEVKEGILHTPDAQGESEAETQQGWGEMLSEKISSGSSYLSSMIGKGENKGEELIEKGGDKIRDSITPNPENANIHSAVGTSLYVGKKVTGAAVTVGDFVLTNLAKITWTAGEHVYSYVSNTEQVKSYAGNHHTEQAIALTKSTAKSGGAIYISASDAAKKLLSTSSKEVVSTVDHKYGEPASKVADRSIGITADAIDLATFFNWKSLAVKFGVKALSEGTNRHQDTTAPPAIKQN